MKEVIVMAERAYSEGNVTHLKSVRDRLDALYEKAPVKSVWATLRAVDDLLGQLRRERAQARRG
jgi:hypothetical protein